MDEKYGNYQVNVKEGYVRIDVGDSHEYLVSSDIFGSHENAVRACRVFQRGYITSKQETGKTILELMRYV